MCFFILILILYYRNISDDDSDDEWNTPLSKTIGKSKTPTPAKDTSRNSGRKRQASVERFVVLTLLVKPPLLSAKISFSVQLVMMSTIIIYYIYFH